MNREELPKTYKGKDIRDLSIEENQEMIEEYEKRKLKIMF